MYNSAATNSLYNSIFLVFEEAYATLNCPFQSVIVTLVRPTSVASDLYFTWWFRNNFDINFNDCSWMPWQCTAVGGVEYCIIIVCGGFPEIRFCKLLTHLVGLQCNWQLHRSKQRLFILRWRKLSWQSLNSHYHSSLINSTISGLCDINWTWTTVYVGKPSAIGRPTRPIQPFIPLVSINE